MAVATGVGSGLLLYAGCRPLRPVDILFVKHMADALQVTVAG